MKYEIYYTELGNLRRNDLFIYGGTRFKVGRVIKGTNGYVACVNTLTHKVTRFYIATKVEVAESEVLNDVRSGTN